MENYLAEKGSKIAKDGFKNEKDVANKFNNWKNDKEAKIWLVTMGYEISDIEYVKATILSGYKADLNVRIQIKLKQNFDIENIQVKLVSNKKGFNQIDKRWLKNYNDMWKFPNNIYKLLQYFTGEILPYKFGRNNKRMFLDEFDKNGIKPDIIILDPPRAGVGEKTLNKLLKYDVKDIIYVSCNPKTFNIDLKVLQENGYELVKMVTVDMFPVTPHMEVVSRLKKLI